MLLTGCRAVQLHSHMLWRAYAWEQTSEQTEIWIFQRPFGVRVYVSFMEQTNTKEAALQIHFTPFARDKELNIAAAEALIDNARPLWSEHDGTRRRHHRLKPAAQSKQETDGTTHLPLFSCLEMFKKMALVAADSDLRQIQFFPSPSPLQLKSIFKFRDFLLLILHFQQLYRTSP